MSTTHASIRSRIKQQRRQLDITYQQETSYVAAQLIKQQKFFIKSQHVALYLPMHGEISPLPLVQMARQLGKHIYLPVLMPFLSNRLWFAPWYQHTKLQANRFGIPEPIFHGKQLISPTSLDLVITPLVAFDPACHRIGMGGGYYDRTFNFLRFRQHWHSPRLVGLAYELQKIKHINAQTWDVPLHAVVSEKCIYQP